MTSESAKSSRRPRPGAARARELTVHASLLALALWLAVAADLLSPGPWGRFSNSYKGKDFVQFYVMGSLARTGRFEVLVDPTAFREAQAPYFRAEVDRRFPPVYGPHLALLLAPLTLLPYLPAYAFWVLLTLAVTAWAVRACWQRCPPLRHWPASVVAITAAYPPLAYLVLAGQLSAAATAAMTLAVIGLGRNSPVLTGAALGVLGYKISLLAPAVAICLMAGEFAIVLVAGSVLVVSVLLAGPIVGWEVLAGFAQNIAGFAEAPDVLARNTFLMASFRTFWRSLLPETAATGAYIISALACIAAAARGWQRHHDPLMRGALLSIGTVLASPHLYFYDLVILAPAFVASAGILVGERAPALRWCTYLAFLVPLAAPLAAVTHFQPATVVFAAWLVVLARTPPAPALAATRVMSP